MQLKDFENNPNFNDFVSATVSEILQLLDDKNKLMVMSHYRFCYKNWLRILKDGMIIASPTEFLVNIGEPCPVGLDPIIYNNCQELLEHTAYQMQAIGQILVGNGEDIGMDWVDFMPQSMRAALKERVESN